MDTDLYPPKIKPGAWGLTITEFHEGSIRTGCLHVDTSINYYLIVLHFPRLRSDYIYLVYSTAPCGSVPKLYVSSSSYLCGSSSLLYYVHFENLSSRKRAPWKLVGENE